MIDLPPITLIAEIKTRLANGTLYSAGDAELEELIAQLDSAWRYYFNSHTLTSRPDDLFQKEMQTRSELLRIRELISGHLNHRAGCND